MTVSPRTQYLYARSVVDLVERREERGALDAPDVNLAALATTTASHADLRQADYYQEMLDELRTEVKAELAHHYASLAVRETNGDAPSVRRSQRIIRVKEAELAEIDRLTDALSSRFPTSGLDGQKRNSSVSHQIHGGLPTTDTIVAVAASADSPRPL
jgi:hypothetical protein